MIVCIADDEVFSWLADEGGCTRPTRTWHSAIPDQFHHTGTVAGPQGRLLVWNQPGYSLVDSRYWWHHDTPSIAMSTAAGSSDIEFEGDG